MTEEVAGKLGALAADLRSSGERVATYLDLLEARFRARESEVKAFVPEPGRFDRLREGIVGGLGERGGSDQQGRSGEVVHGHAARLLDVLGRRGSTEGWS